MKISISGERHLGAVIGSKDFKESYVKSMVSKWIEDVEELSEIAKFEPQLAYSAFTKGICHRWTYFMRTIPEICEYLLPLEKVINDTLIPALVGKHVSQLERDIIELPVRFGGLGIINPSTMANREYECSRIITEPLVSLINNRDNNLDNLNRGDVQER